MIIIAGSSNLLVAKEIAEGLSIPLIKADIKKFEDQELRVQIEGKLYEQEVIIVQSTSKPANDNLLELLLIADTAKRAGARRIIAVIPYFGYSRQDRLSYLHGPISASLVASMLEVAGINRVITLDLHSKQIEGFFKVGVQNLDSFSLFADLFKSYEDKVIVSPDIGGTFRAQGLAKKLNCGLVVINKTRNAAGECNMLEVIGDVQGKHCIIIDDIIDTAGTICCAAKILIEKGALSIKVCASHAVFSGNAIDLIEKSCIERLYVSNSIEHKNLSKKIEVIDIKQILINTLKLT